MVPDSADSPALRGTIRSVRAFSGCSKKRVSLDQGMQACATLVKESGSYTVAAQRAGTGVSVRFLRKWDKIHTLPEPIRSSVVQGHIPPTAASHLARIPPRSQPYLAAATVDADLTVHEVRDLVGKITSGTSTAKVLAEKGIPLGDLESDHF